MHGLETRVDVSLEDGVLVLRLPAFERGLRGFAQQALAGRLEGSEEPFDVRRWLRTTLGPGERMALLELLDPPIHAVAKEAALMKARSLPGDMSKQSFMNTLVDWIDDSTKDDPPEARDTPWDRLLWRVCNEVRDFCLSCDSDLLPKYKEGHDHLMKRDQRNFWTRCCKLVAGWIDECLDTLWDDYLQRHGRTE